AGDVRHWGRRRGGREPGLCHPENEPEVERVGSAGIWRQRLTAEDLQCGSAVHGGTTGAEMGWGMANYNRSVSRPGDRFRGGAGAHFYPDGGVVPFVSDPVGGD